ncbi:hypothetical protein GCM10010228_65280 [Streptomyces massasporeus]|nr:hypothetical protein GCM10010228_65280 [Streptomyces massasporeus]
MRMLCVMGARRAGPFGAPFRTARSARPTAITHLPFSGQLKKNAVWTSLPFVKADKVHRLPDGIWMFGGPGSMEAYIDALVGALTK